MRKLLLATAAALCVFAIHFAVADVSLTDVNIGSAPGDGTGDPARTAFTKINNNNADIEADLNAAIHDNVAAEISAVTEKTTPVAADLLLIEDSAASNAKKRLQIGNLPNPVESFIVAASDETSDLTTGTSVVTFRMPYAFTVTAVRASVSTAGTGSTIVVDINEGGASILSTALSIDASEETSTTAATPAVISDSSLADDAEITFDIDQIGSSTAGAGLKIAIIGVQP